MKGKTKKQLKPTPEYDSERETRVLLEELRSDVKKIAEQTTSNSEKLKKLDKLETDFAEVKSEINSIKVATMENSGQIKVNSELIKENERQLKVNGELIKENNNKIDRIEKKLDTVIVDHERRLQRLEVT